MEIVDIIKPLDLIEDLLVVQGKIMMNGPAQQVNASLALVENLGLR